jgi:hypothetical protein
MKSFFFIFSGLLLAGSLSAQTVVLRDTCLPSFKMVDLEPAAGCNAPARRFLHGAPTYRMLGKRLADGFSWYRPAMSVGGSNDYLYAHNGSTVPPAGVIFRNCPANWTYFKVVGFNEAFRPSDAHEYTNIYARVRSFGDERNPDSIRVEFSGNLFRNYYGSFEKDTLCNKCVATDKTPPMIRKCPTQTVTTIWTTPTVMGENAFRLAHLNIADNCNVESSMTFPYITRNAQAGQTIAYKTVAYDASGNAATCKFNVLYAKPLADTCLPRFVMAGNQTETCNQYIAPHLFGAPTFQMLGKRMSDGFAWVRPSFPGGWSREFVYARNGTTTPPAGVSFRTCPGNWIYFKLVGFNQSARGRPLATEATNLYARVRYFGNERNPDSIRVDFGGDWFFLPNYASIRKDTVCDKCLATDVLPPVIRNCPTQVLSYPLTAHSLSSSTIFNAANLQVADNCGVTHEVTFPYYKLDAQIGQTVDYKTLSYDEVGNLATCHFKVKYVQATPDLELAGYATPDTYAKNSTVVFSIYVGNRTLNRMKNVRITVPFPPNTKSGGTPTPSIGTWHETCANGQKCYEWVIPEMLGQTSANIQIPIFIPNLTTPITVTAKLLESTPADGNASNNQRSITIQPLNGVAVTPQLVENQIVPIVVNELSPNPTDGALVVTLTSKVAQSLNFDIYNAYGQKVHSVEQTVSLGENQLFFDLTKLTTGTYFIQCSDQAVRSEKVTFVKY